MAKSIKINALFKTLMSIVNIIFPLLTIPYVARILSMDGYTEYNKSVSMVTWFTPFAEFGVYTYGMRTVSQLKNNIKAVSRLFTHLFSFSFITSCIVTCIYLLLVLLMPSFQSYRLMYIFASAQIFFVFFATDWLNEAYENYGFILIKTFFCRIIYIVAVFIFVKKSDDVLIYVFLTSFSFLLNNILTFLYAKRKIPFSSFSIKEEVILVKPLCIIFLLVNSSMLYTIFDRFILTWFSDKLFLTYYNMSQTIVIAVINVTSSVLLVSIPRLSYLWANEKKQDYYNLLKKTSDTFMCLHTPCCIGLACVAYEVIYFYSGIKYIQAYTVLLLFSLRYYISAFDMILAKQVLLATGNEKVLTKIYYIGGIFNVIAKIVLIIIKRLTPELCILTTAMVDILVIVLQLLNIKRLKIQFSIFSKKKLKYFITGLLFVPIILCLRLILPTDEIKLIVLRTIMSVLICTIVYLTMLLLTKDDFLMSLFRRKNNEKELHC